MAITVELHLAQAVKCCWVTQDILRSLKELQCS